jgi:hypothetical protein
MSVESGIGVACGCLPGCKPLMSRMFPRIFGNTSRSTSYPRPSAQIQGKQTYSRDSSQQLGSQQQDSYHLSLVGTSGSGVVVTERQNIELGKSRSRQVPRTSSELNLSGSGRMLRECDDISNASTDLIILQRASAQVSVSVSSF